MTHRTPLLTLITLLTSLTLHASPLLDHTILQRAHGSFTRMADSVDLLPSLAASAPETAAQRLHDLQEVLNTIIASRESLTPDQRMMVNEYIAFYAALTPERLASMDDLTAHDAQQELKQLHALLQPHLLPQRSSCYTMPTTLTDALRTLEIHTDMLLEPAYYPRASWWQRVKHIARNPGSAGAGSSKELATAAFLSVVIIGSTIVLKRITQKQHPDASPEVATLMQANIDLNSDYTQDLTSLQTALQEVVSFYDRSPGPLSTEQSKWVVKARKFLKTPANEQEPPPNEASVTKAFEHLVAQQYLTLPGKCAAQWFRWTGIDLSAVNFPFLSTHSPEYARAEKAVQGALTTRLAEQLSALESAHTQIATKVTTDNKEQQSALATLTTEIIRLKGLPAKSVTALTESISASQKLLRRLLRFYAEISLSSRVEKGRRESSVTAADAFSTTATEHSSPDEPDTGCIGLPAVTAQSARVLQEHMAMLFAQIRKRIASHKNPLLRTGKPAPEAIAVLEAELAALTRQYAEYPAVIEALLALHRKAALPPATLPSPHDDDDSDDKTLRKPGTVKYEFRWQLPTLT